MSETFDPEELEEGLILAGLKNRLSQNTTQENLLALLGCLRSSEVYVPMQVLLSQRDQQRILNQIMKDGNPQVEPGMLWSNEDQIRMKPDILKAPDGSLWYPIFTRLQEIPKDYLEQFSAIPVPVPDCLEAAHHTENVAGLVLDPFSEVNFQMPFELADLMTRQDLF